MPRSLAAVGLSVLGALSSGCVDIVATGTPRYVERVERSFALTGRPDVAVSTFDGSIEVHSWDRPDVLVVIEKTAADKGAAERMEVRAEQTGNRIVLDVLRPTGEQSPMSWLGSRGARLIVTMPEAGDLRAKSGDGSITVDRLVGRIHLESGDGSVRARDLSGDLTAYTGDGSVHLDNVSGKIDVRTGDGSIVIGGRLSALKARSGDGSVRIQAEEGSGRAGDWDITTGDGTVTLQVAEDFGAELDARTGDGRVQVRGIDVDDTRSTRERRELHARIGDGGRQVRVRSGDGSIIVRPI